jgi:hypothetical protein
MSAGPAGISSALPSDPFPRIFVPLVAAVAQLSQGGLDVVPALFVVEAAADQLGDEGAPLTSTDPPVELGDQRIIQRYV